MAFDRLRFDFNFHRPLLEHELIVIEELINGWVADATHLQTKVMALTDAKRAGAIAMFGEKYGEQVCHFSVTFLCTFDFHCFLLKKNCLLPMIKNDTIHKYTHFRFIYMLR